MLVSAVIRLQAAEASRPWQDMGRAAQAWFLDQVRAADPALAMALHQGDGLRPLVTS